MSNAVPPRSRTRTWLLAVRPWAYSASIATVALGIALVFYRGHPIDWPLFLLTLVGVVCFHTAANLLNDCFDHVRGLDTAVYPMSGAIVRGLLTESQVFRAAMIFLAIGTACGLVLAYVGGWMILLLGALGMVLTVGYTRRGFCFKYAGLGDLAIFIAFGVLPVFGTYWVQTRTFSWLPILWSLPLVSYTVAILHANNWRDIDGDTGKNCRTMASLLGPRGSDVYYRILLLGPFVMVVLYLALDFMMCRRHRPPIATLLVLAALPTALNLSRVRRANNTSVFALLDGKTAQLHLLFGSLLTIAFFADRLFERLF